MDISISFEFSIYVSQPLYFTSPNVPALFIFSSSNFHFQLLFSLQLFVSGPDPECDQKCENGGVCDVDQRCLCPEGYMGQYCNTALCYPQCMNGGTCTTPGRCSCPPGFQGRHCEGGKGGISGWHRGWALYIEGPFVRCHGFCFITYIVLSV